jgi:hypothetical protein
MQWYPPTSHGVNREPVVMLMVDHAGVNFFLQSFGLLFEPVRGSAICRELDAERPGLLPTTYCKLEHEKVPVDQHNCLGTHFDTHHPCGRTMAKEIRWRASYTVDAGSLPFADLTPSNK